MYSIFCACCLFLVRHDFPSINNSCDNNSCLSPPGYNDHFEFDLSPTGPFYYPECPHANALHERQRAEKDAQRELKKLPMSKVLDKETGTLTF